MLCTANTRKAEAKCACNKELMIFEDCLLAYFKPFV